MNDLINQIKNEKLKFIEEELFINIIKKTIKNFFPNLNKEDIYVLEVLTIFTVDFISFKYGFEQNKEYYLQWQQNNCSDIKGVILLLLPFIDDKNNSLLLIKLPDLNHLLYSKSERYIPDNILELNQSDILPTHFKYGNMGIGLLPNAPKNNILLDLYPNNEKLIYKVIQDNFYGLLQTINIINGKSYINWINIQPLNLNNYQQSYIFKATEKYLDLGFDNIVKSIYSIDFDYQGLWLGDFYNVFRIKYYEEAKKVKWLFFPYERSPTDCKYLINILHEMFDLEKIINHESDNYDDIDEFDKINFIKNAGNILYKLNDEINLEVIKYTLIWFVNNYTKKNKIKNSEINMFILDSSDDDLEENDDFSNKDFKKINNIEPEQIINGLKYIINNHIGHLWNFLKECIQLLIKSAFGKFLIINENQKLIINNNYYYKTMTFLNLKNIYNISKSLSHTDKWITLDKHYISLNITNKENFFKKIYNNNQGRWFNYSNNYKRQKKYIPNPTKDEIEEYEKNVLSDFLSVFKLIVFEELVSTGILNKFVPNLDITDKTRLPQNTFALQKKRKLLSKELFKQNKINWGDSFYYLTNNKFKYIPKMRNPKKTNN
jgi:hypothetical protein